MIMNPTAIKHVVVDGHSLTLESFVAIARYNATVELAPSALEAMKKSRALAEKIAAEGRVAYGITTGFGEFQKVAVPKEMSNQLSTNLILSHCTAAGEPYADEIVRGMMLLRANALCGGVSGVRPILVEMLLEMLNKGVTPVVPQKGSLGSSGDLAPLAHMTLPMLGKGEAMYEGVKMPGAEAMAKAGIKTLDTLVSKEGLGMTNGTCAMTSVGALALYDTICAAQLRGSDRPAQRLRPPHPSGARPEGPDARRREHAQAARRLRDPRQLPEGPRSGRLRPALHPAAARCLP